MKFGVYVHIPYCIQRCTYCDFATYEQSKIMAPADYVQLLHEEIRQKRGYYAPRKLDTLYFGGGTPSLLEPKMIVSIIHELEKHGFTTGPGTEITLEINPATLTREKLKYYVDHGFNRFSVGAQTFDDKLLKMVKREHNAKQTLETLDLLRSFNLNFSFDILFALPTQTLAGLRRDVEIAVEQGSAHISPYCLTVPETHPLAKGRALEDEQVDMFELIASELGQRNFQQYEISNFARPGFESQHNLLYWTDENYWGLGLSAHSYSKHSSWGTRYWNASTIELYQKQVLEQKGQSFATPESQLPENQFEVLEKHQALTDFCHTSLRLMRGLDERILAERFPANAGASVLSTLQQLADKGLVKNDKGHWALTQSGLVISNQVFRDLTFLSSDLD